MKIHNIDAQGSGELLRVVEMHEDVKEIMRVANEINLAAINAMLISNKLGKVGNGFSVVSVELHAFSGRLSETMDVVLTYVAMLVKEAAGLIRLNKSVKLQKFTEEITAHFTYWDEMRIRKSGELEHIHVSIENCREQLRLVVRSAIKICIMGQALSNSARIEAAYGGAQANSLRNVSERVEDSIGEILSTLGALDKQLEAIA